MRKAPPLIYSEKVDTKVTPEMLKQIQALMTQEDRNKSDMLRVLLKRGIAETILKPDIR